ncbi:MAG: hydrolase [Bacillota bacterium]|jgi:2-keto-3-deoxy-6-phosphogluconate aldolase|nr:hydrolase [Bacillota bacterium]NLU54756.1 hydrolase [Bacillota bacterium]HOA90352.1 hydrolase [Bacillota bacterium]HOP54403.1 hydrolase [Bacillota bacterium]HPT62188.1 hydrolase [Bacillota bacterium]
MIPELSGSLRKNQIIIPSIINEASGVRINGKLIKSLLFSTDVAVIRNTNADAVIAVYPFSPQPVITEALRIAADVPLFVGVGGGTTAGLRVVNLALHAEFQGVMGVVLNAPIKNEVLARVAETIDIPIVITVVSENEDIEARLRHGASILNVSAAKNTPDVVRKIRERFPDVPIFATGGPTDETIAETIAAGANAITYTPPASKDIFKGLMNKYREELNR